MSEKNDNVNSGSSNGDEFLKKNLPMNKICPQCGKIYTDQEIVFCYSDGMKLTLTNQQKTQQPQPRKYSPFSADFSGFELNLQSAAQNVQIPIEIIQSTTRLIQPNPKIPTDSENVRSWFWSIPTPRKKRNVFLKLMSNVGFSRTNLYAYFICYLLVVVTYGIWISRANPAFFTELTGSVNPKLLLIIAGLSFYTVLLLIIPILSLGYTESETFQASRKDFFLRIEPSLFLMIIGLNYLIMTFGGAIPILLIPGEPKVKVTPPVEHVVRSIKRSVFPSLLLGLGAFAFFIIAQYFPIPVIPYVKTNAEILAYFTLSILILELFPFGNTIGKILLKHQPKTFTFSITLVLTLIAIVITLSVPF